MSLNACFSPPADKHRPYFRYVLKEKITPTVNESKLFGADRYKWLLDDIPEETGPIITNTTSSAVWKEDGAFIYRSEMLKGSTLG